MLEKRPVLLWIDGKKESTLAQRVCDEYNIRYSLIDIRDFASTDVKPPQLFDVSWGEFKGLERITFYAKQFGYQKEHQKPKT